MYKGFLMAGQNQNYLILYSINSVFIGNFLWIKKIICILEVDLEENLKVEVSIFSRYKNNKYEEPVQIFSSQQYKESVFAPAVSPEGDYLVFVHLLPRGSKSPWAFSLNVCFLEKNNEWSKPLALSEIINMGGGQPRITPDGKYLFFVERNQCFWIDTEIINSLKKEQE